MPSGLNPTPPNPPLPFGRDGAAALVGGVGLLERSVSYLLGNLQLVTPDALAGPTPCPHWDLRALLEHLDDSLLALHELADVGSAGIDLPPAHDAGTDLVRTVRNRACRLVGAWAAADGRHTVSVGGLPLTAAIVCVTGAVEVAVHGWDVAQACGRHRPVPPSLASELMELVPLFVTAEDRQERFAAPVVLPARANEGDQLIAYLGRHPHLALVNRAGSWLCRL